MNKITATRYHDFSTGHRNLPEQM